MKIPRFNKEQVRFIIENDYNQLCKCEKCTEIFNHLQEVYFSDDKKKKEATPNVQEG